MSALDPTTWLPNRELFLARLQRTVAAAGRVRAHLALLYIDLDRFQDFNDLFGREAGDRVLHEAAVRILRACPRGTRLGRVGGDDFAAVVKGGDAGRIAKLARTVLEDCGAPYVVHCVSVPVTASIGIALYPLHGKDGAELMRSAERALYRAKLNGRNCFYPFQAASAA